MRCSVSPARSYCTRW